MIYFGLPLWCSHRSCHVFGKKRYFAVFVMKSVWPEVGLRSRAGMFRCMYLLFGRCSSHLEIVLGFWKAPLWMNCCLVLFQKPSSWVKFYAGKPPFGISPLEPIMALEVTLQGCREGAMMISSPSSSDSVPPSLAPLCLWLSQWWHQSYCCLCFLIYLPSRFLIMGT